MAKLIARSHPRPHFGHDLASWALVESIRDPFYVAQGFNWARAEYDQNPRIAMSHKTSFTRSGAHAQTHVVARVANRIGFIELERPEALNALSSGMVDAMHAALEQWREDPDVLAVVVLQRHARAFCAGGDIRFLYESFGTGDQRELDTFFIDEYRLDHAIFTYPKPYIALMNGVVMGGGMGISQGAHRRGGLRVVDASTRMAMPETRIGLFPDVGAGWFLARTPGAIGRYLAVTGETIGAADALYAGLADVYLDDAALPALLGSLQTEPFETGADVVA